MKLVYLDPTTRFFQATSYLQSCSLLVSSQVKLASLTLKPRYYVEQDELDSEDIALLTERGQSVNRTLRTLQEQLSQNPLESELLLVASLRKTPSVSQSTPRTPRRPSVIHQTPPVTPLNHLSPQEPSGTPEISHLDNNTVFAFPPIARPTGSRAVSVISTGSIERSSSDLIVHHKSLSGECNYNSFSRSAFSLPLRSAMADPSEVVAELDDAEHEAEFSFRNFPANGLDEKGLVKDYEDSLSELKTIVKRFSKAVRILGSLNNLEPGLLETWKSKLTKFESDLNVYRREVRRRIADLTSQTIQQPPPSQILSITPTVENTGTDSHVLSHTQEQLNEFQQKAAREKKKAASKAKCSMSTIKQDLQELTEEYSEHNDWEEAEDYDVQKAMGNIKAWKEKLSKVKKDTAMLEALVTGEDLDDLSDDLSRLKVQVSKVNDELTTAVTNIKSADEEKGLYCDREKKSSPTPFPIFSGSPNEDFVEFSNKFEKAVIGNKIPKSDQLDKLREQLRGKAKNQVPIKVDSIDRAWELLKSAYGDPMILLRYRKQALQKLGCYPKSQSKNNPQKLVEWCLDLERIIDDLLKLGEREARLEMIAYNDDTLNELVDLFPMRLVFKIERLEVHGKEKLEEIATILEDERKILQRLALRPQTAIKKSSKPGGEDSGPKNTHRVSTLQPKGLSLFASPRKLSSCRICKELEKQGDNRDLYELHWGNYPTHCPRWANMSNEVEI